MGGTTDMWGPQAILPADGVRLLVGRAPSAGAVLGHPAVSRQHAELRLSGGQLEVRDLGSRFGTRVNGEGIKERVLRDGDQVEFGAVGYEVRGGWLVLRAHSEGVRLDAYNLAVDRGGKQLLADVRLSVAPNQFVGLLGTSGCGKSTLIKCLAGYLPPAAGSLRIDGRLNLPDHLDSYRPLVGYVPQKDVVYDTLSVRENLDYALRLRFGDMPSPERALRISHTLERLRLTEHADKAVRVLSGGQCKRLNVGLELLGQPRVLFLDEPTSGLDPANELRLMTQLKNLAGGGVTVVYATHVLENLCLFDHVVVLANRTVVYDGPPAALLHRFGVHSHAELYTKLEDGGAGLHGAIGSPVAAKSVGSEVLRAVDLVPVRAHAPDPVAPRTAIGTQVGVQIARGARLILRDRTLVALLIGQPVFIGCLINLSQVKPDGLKAMFLFAAVTAVWLGLNNTAREAVRDRAVYLRERLMGVTPEGYLGAKVILFAGVGLVQVCLLVGVIRYANLLGETAMELAAWPPAYLVLVLWVTYLAAMLLGLLVSTLVKSQEAAVAALPLIVLPQLLLTGVATGLQSETAANGTFGPLVVLTAKAREDSPRGLKRWALEAASLATYTRPALSLLQEPDSRAPVAPEIVVAATDWLHALFLLVTTAAALVAVFRWRERYWLKEA